MLWLEIPESFIEANESIPVDSATRESITRVPEKPAMLIVS